MTTATHGAVGAAGAANSIGDCQTDSFSVTNPCGKGQMIMLAQYSYFEGRRKSFLQPTIGWMIGQFEISNFYPFLAFTF